jgi:hypothetical protein
MLFKRSIIHFLGSVALLSTMLACGDEHNILRNQVTASGARIKFIHAVVDGPAIDVFANDAKINGAALSYGNLFPTEYSVVAPGTVNMKVATPASGSVAAVTVLTAPLSLENDKYYTIAATGSSTAPAGLLVQDDLSVPDPTKNYIRVLNLLTTGQSVDLAVGTAAPLISNVAPRTSSPYVAVAPNVSTAPYALQTRLTSTTTVVGATLNYSNPNVGRKFTIVVRGAVGRTGTAAPTLSQVTNK